MKYLILLTFFFFSCANVVVTKNIETREKGSRMDYYEIYKKGDTIIDREIVGDSVVKTYYIVEDIK